ncbi:hypothetical protein [Aneurinibacillus migulanus]|uniref:hypothetical protein n=1 Tax=Aneurinibacillus migulanus TaxID=47500 RepID=UPI00209D292D|nr:hypothetical protein [Aneurinibacillus migulanus]MCP1359022.1 hypothetical protein [Aneurinibacillus migulanus]
MPNKKRKRHKVKNRLTQVRQVNLVRNGGFETGVFSPWTPTGNVFIGRTNPRTGTFEALFTPQSGDRPAFLSQIIFFNPPLRDLYRLRFFVYTPSSTGVLQINFRNSAIPSRTLPLVSIPRSSYRGYSIVFPSSQLRGASLELEFVVSSGAPMSSLLFLDDVSITPVIVG